MKNTILYLLIAASLCSCRSATYYLPAATGNDIAYLPRPMSVDSSNAQFSVSGSYSAASIPWEAGTIRMAQLSFSRGHSYNHINFAYGAFGFAGNTKYDTQFSQVGVPAKYGYRSFSGVGFRSSVGFHLTSGNVEFRILNWENALTFESGDYASFRREVQAVNDYYVNSSTKTKLYTTGGSTELIFHSGKPYDYQLGCRLFIGTTLGLNEISPNGDYTAFGGAVSGSVFMKSNHVYGVFDTSINNSSLAIKFSFGYTF